MFVVLLFCLIIMVGIGGVVGFELLVEEGLEFCGRISLYEIL